MQKIILYFIFNQVQLVTIIKKIKNCLNNFIMAENPETKKSRTIKLLQSDIHSINRNQLNSSSSKMQYSVPKAPRFVQKKDQNNNSKFYDIPDTKTDRSTSLGYGNKMDLAKQYFIKPGPGQYDYKSQFEEDKKKGITISAGRQIVKNNSAFQIVKNIPGPGQYNPKNPLLDQLDGKKGYSISGRNKDLSNKFIQIVPGPGKYQTLELLDKNLKSLNSRIQNVKTSRFNKSKRKSQFEQKIRQNIPGPGQYVKQDKEEKLAKYHLNHGYKFSHSQRDGIIQKSKLSTPGPGAYKQFSEFLH